MEKRFDCLIVGGGPAGSSAARRLALSGKSVLILEKSFLPRAKCCAGGLTPKVIRLLDFDLGPIIEQEVEQGGFSYRNSRPYFPRTPPLGLKMVRRDRFDHFLVQQAVTAGAELWEGTALLDMSVQRDHVEAQTTRGNIRASATIGADGALSQVARSSGLWQKRETAIALSREIRLPRNRKGILFSCVLFDFGEVSWGYRWSFPKGDHLSLGLFSGREKGKKLLSLLEGFPQTGSSSEVLETPLRGHPLPCFGAYEPLYGERVILCGDAAGLVDPLTGEGISQAIESGLLAAEIIHDFLGRGISLARYAQIIHETLGQELSHADRLARFFFKHPYFSYRLLSTHPGTASLFVRVMQGEISYRDLYLKLKEAPLGRLYSFVKTAKSKVFGPYCRSKAEG